MFVFFRECVRVNNADVRLHIIFTVKLDNKWTQFEEFRKDRGRRVIHFFRFHRPNIRNERESQKFTNYSDTNFHFYSWIIQVSRLNCNQRQEKCISQIWVILIQLIVIHLIYSNEWTRPFKRKFNWIIFEIKEKLRGFRPFRLRQSRKSPLPERNPQSGLVAELRNGLRGEIAGFFGESLSADPS